MIFAFCTIALAMSISCRSPPDIFRHPLSLSFNIPSLSKAAAAFSLSFSPGTENSPIWLFIPIATLSSTVWLNTGLDDCGIYAIYFDSSLPFIKDTSFPSISIFPFFIGRKPNIHLKNVLFPTPFGPRTAIASLPEEENETLFSTLFSP